MFDTREFIIAVIVWAAITSKIVYDLFPFAAERRRDTTAAKADPAYRKIKSAMPGEFVVVEAPTSLSDDFRTARIRPAILREAEFLGAYRVEDPDRSWWDIITFRRREQPLPAGSLSSSPWRGTTVVGTGVRAVGINTYFYENRDALVGEQRRATATVNAAGRFGRDRYHLFGSWDAWAALPAVEAETQEEAEADYGRFISGRQRTAESRANHYPY